MILAVHILVGAIIALHLKPLILALVLAVLSHYFLDLLPHWDYNISLGARGRKWKTFTKDFLKITVDFSLGILLVVLFSKNPLISLVGALFSLVPDALWFAYFLLILLPSTNGSRVYLKVLTKLRQGLKVYYDFHTKIHFPENPDQVLSKFWLGRRKLIKKTSPFWRILVEAAVFLVSFYFLL